MQDGISIKFGVDDRMWCCKTTEDPCVAEGIGMNIICNGNALSLSDQCHNENYVGPSCNYHPLDAFRNGNMLDSYGKSSRVFRSYLDLCQDNRYLQH